VISSESPLGDVKFFAKNATGITAQAVTDVKLLAPLNPVEQKTARQQQRSCCGLDFVACQRRRVGKPNRVGLVGRAGFEPATSGLKGQVQTEQDQTFTMLFCSAIEKKSGQKIL